MRLSRRSGLTPTSYAILGLLALRDWSAYELTQQMARTMRLWWPRAESRVYEEPKRLVGLGLATNRQEGKGLRPRTVYSITEEGRRALEGWVGTPAGIFRMEFEAMLKVFFADQGTKADLLANIRSIREAAEADLERSRACEEAASRGDGPFPERLHITALVSDLSLRLLTATREWAEDAERQVEGWSSTRGVPDALPVFRRRLRAGRGGRRAEPPAPTREPTT